MPADNVQSHSLKTGDLNSMVTEVEYMGYYVITLTSHESRGVSNHRQLGFQQSIQVKNKEK